MPTLRKVNGNPKDGNSNVKSRKGNYEDKIAQGDLIVSTQLSRLSSPCSRSGWEHYIVFLGKKLDSHSASLHPGV